MAFIRKITNREGTVYVSLVEGYRDNGKLRQRTIKNYGRLDKLEKDNPNAYADLVKEAANYIDEDRAKFVTTTLDLGKNREPSSLKNFGYQLINSVYDELGIEKVISQYSKNPKYKYDLNDILKLLVFQRVIDPNSKLEATNFQNVMLKDLNVDYAHIMRSLDHFCELQKPIQNAIHNKVEKSIGRDSSLVFYDVTNTFFQTSIDDSDKTNKDGNPRFEEPIKQRGKSKEHQPKPVVQLGLFMDNNAIPISYNTYPGNTHDSKTYIPSKEIAKAQFGVDRMVIVADKGLNGAPNIKATLAAGDGYIFSQQIRGKSPKNVIQLALDESEWIFNESQTFGYKSAILPRVTSAGKVIVEKEKVVITWSEKYAKREKIRRDGALEYAEGLTQAERFRQACRKGGKRFTKMVQINPSTGGKEEFRPVIEVDYEKVAQEELFDGVNVLVTSELEMPELEIINHYKELWQIENNFRTMKTGLDLRPVYVWTDPHIQAHFLVCFIALTILRIMHSKIDKSMSIDGMLNGMRSALCSEVGKGYYQTFSHEDTEVLFSKFNINLEKEIQSINKITALGRQKIIGEKRS
jgi:transposase